MKRIKLIRIIIFTLLFSAGGLIILMNIYNPKAIKIENELKTEFNYITQLPEAVLIKVDSSHKTGQALVTGIFSTSLNYIKIRKYYDKELPRHGWKFIGEKVLTDWFRDFGGKMATYRKGNYKLTLTYAGEKANYGWDYSIDISWGLE